jgi:hypothetical protein
VTACVRSSMKLVGLLLDRDGRGGHRNAATFEAR